MNVNTLLPLLAKATECADDGQWESWADVPFLLQLFFGMCIFFMPPDRFLYS